MGKGEEFNEIFNDIMFGNLADTTVSEKKEFYF